MKKSEFPEKAYEVFANHELLSMGYMLYIPSQLKEQRLGYDALLHLKNRRIKAVALQYKIVSEYERAPKLFSKRCFKFELHKSSTGEYLQHNIMVKKNTRSWPPISAFYCVPCFVEYKVLYKHLQNGVVLKNSCFLKPSSEINDSKYHYVKFDSNQACQFSDDPKPMEIHSLDSLFEQQESVLFEDIMRESCVDEKHLICKIDEYLLQSQSFLLIKLSNENSV